MDTVILLHGWGERGERWRRLIDCVEAQTQRPIRWITPTAPESPQAVSGYRTLLSWYNLEFGHDGKQPYHGAVTHLYLEAVAVLIREIERVVAGGTPPERIVIGGFSQGGCIALATMLLMREPRIGGVVLIGGSLQSIETLKAYVEHHGGALALANRFTPVLYLQGDRDFSTGSGQMDITRDYLVRDLGFTHWHHRVFPDVEHQVAPEMERVTATFILDCFA